MWFGDMVYVNNFLAEQSDKLEEKGSSFQERIYVNNFLAEQSDKLEEKGSTFQERMIAGKEYWMK